MDVTLKDGFRALEEAAEQARLIRIELDAEYLHHIAMVEAMPANQSGSDKTWVHETSNAPEGDELSGDCSVESEPTP